MSFRVEVKQLLERSHSTFRVGCGGKPLLERVQHSILVWKSESELLLKSAMLSNCNYLVR